MTRKEKWNKVTTDIIKAIDKVETDDLDERVMLLDIMSTLGQMTMSEEYFNDCVDQLRREKHKTLILTEKE